MAGNLVAVVEFLVTTVLTSLKQFFLNQVFLCFTVNLFFFIALRVIFPFTDSARAQPVSTLQTKL